MGCGVAMRFFMMIPSPGYAEESGGREAARARSYLRFSMISSMRP